MDDAVEIGLIVGIPLLVLTLVLVIVVRRQRRAWAELGAQEMMTAASRLPLGENWRIRRAIGAGRAVADPALATLAADRADYQVRAAEYNERKMERVRWAYPLLACVWLALGVLRLLDDPDTADWYLSALSFALAVLMVAQRPWIGHRKRRAVAAVAANRALAAAHPDARRTGPTLDPRATFRRRLVLGWVALVAVTAPLYYALSLLIDASLGWGWSVGYSVAISTLIIASLGFSIPPLRDAQPPAESIAAPQDAP